MGKRLWGSQLHCSDSLVLGGCVEVEVINSITGKTVQGKISRIAKQGFFMRYGALVAGLPQTQAQRHIDCDYGELKAQVREYQTAKTELFLAFKREDLGCWLKKPMEQDQFHLASGNSNNCTSSPPPPVAAAAMMMEDDVPLESGVSFDVVDEDLMKPPAARTTEVANGNCSSNYQRNNNNGAQKVRKDDGGIAPGELPFDKHYYDLFQ